MAAIEETTKIDTIYAEYEHVMKLFLEAETRNGQDSDDDETSVHHDSDSYGSSEAPYEVNTGRSYEILLYQACSLALTDILESLLAHLDVVGVPFVNFNSDPKKYHSDLIYDCLVIALEKKHDNIIEILLSHAATQKADTTKPTTSTSPRGSYKVLHCAAANGDVEIVEMLIKAGVDVNQKNRVGETALHVASDSATAAVLLNNGANVNVLNEMEESPLFYACFFYRMGLIKELMEKGSKPITPSEELDSKELNRALKTGVDTNIACALMKFNACSSSLYRNGTNCVQLAINHIEVCDEGEIYPLCARGKNENQAIVQKIRESQFGTKLETNHELPKLHNEILTLQNTRETGLVDMQPITNILIKNDTIVNEVNKFGTTALYLAVERNLIDVATLLLDSGADPNVATFGKHSLIVACRFLSHEFVRLLLERGADPNVFDCYLNSPLFIAAESYDLTLVKTLVEHGADVNRKDGEGRTILHSIVENSFISSCHSYCPSVSCVDTVKYLLDNGFNVNQTNAKGQTVIARVIDVFTGRYNRGKFSRISIPYQLFELLLERGADVNLYDLKGNNALTAATKGESAYALRELLRHGGDPKHVRASGKSLLRIACNKSDPRSVRLLLAAGADPNMIIFLPDNKEVIDLFLDSGVIINTSNNDDNDNMKIPTLGEFRSPFCRESECIVRLFKAGSSLQILADCCRSRREGRTIGQAGLQLNCPLAGLLYKAIVLAGYKVKLQLIDHINGSEDKDLVSWLETDSMTPPTLSRLCRTVIRSQLSAASGYRTILPLIDVLEIPKQMQMYLRFEGSFNEVDLTISDKRTSCKTCASDVVDAYYSSKFFRLPKVPNTYTFEDSEVNFFIM